MSTQDLDTILERYPRLARLRGSVADDVMLRELAPKVEQYEALLARAQAVIPTSHLSDLFPIELEREEVVLRDFLGSWGCIAVEELCKLCLIARWLRPQQVVELGTFIGLTTRQLALNTPDGCRITTVDLDPGSREASDVAVGEIDSHLARKAGAFAFEVGQRFLGTAEARKIDQLWGDSTAIDLSSYAGRVDLVFIDAGHTYDYIKLDTDQALTMLRPGGVIVWHDCFQVLHPDVTLRLCELAEQGMAIHHLYSTNLAVHVEPHSG